MLDKLFRPGPLKQAAFATLDAINAAARDPALFGDGRIADTFEGRFEAVTLFATLVLDRLAGQGRDADALGQETFNQLFKMFDTALREVGVGDLSVGKRIRRMAEAFYGRVAVYRAALGEGDDAALADAVARNVLSLQPADPAFAAALVAHVRAGHAALAQRDLAELLKGGAKLPAFAA
jgi:cytochrome b pre-mRNA-processing protein 3